VDLEQADVNPSEAELYPSSGEGVKFDPKEVLDRS